MVPAKYECVSISLTDTFIKIEISLLMNRALAVPEFHKS